MEKKRNYKQYFKEFKEEAVALVREQGYSAAEAEKALGIYPGYTSNCCIARRIESQLKGKALSQDERDELKQLRKENKNLRSAEQLPIF